MNNAGDGQERSLFVSWRDPEVGSIHPIGRLVRRKGPQGEHYSFAYLKLAERLHGFEPLPGLDNLHERYYVPFSGPDFQTLADLS